MSKSEGLRKPEQLRAAGAPCWVNPELHGQTLVSQKWDAERLRSYHGSLRDSSGHSPLAVPCRPCLSEVKQDGALHMSVLPKHRLKALGGDVAHLRGSGTAELQRNIFLIPIRWFKL